MISFRFFSSSKVSILSLCFSLLITSHCFLHHANISGDGYGLKTMIEPGKELTQQLPVRLEFDPRQKEKIKEYLARKGQNIEISDELVDTYYSEEIIAKFRNSKYFLHTPDANIKIKINPSIEEVRAPVLSFIANIASLGLYPAVTRTYGRIEFNLFDTDQNKIVKTYKYIIEHRQLFSFPSVILGAVLPSFSERFDHSQNERSYSVMRVSFNQFTIDLLNDMGKDKALLSKFLLSKPFYYAIYLDPKNENSNEKAESYLLSSLETAFIERKINLLERKKINKIIDEIKLSQSGLTDSKRLEFGKILSADKLIEVSNLQINPKNTKIVFSIRCIGVESGKILWSETISYENNQNSTQEKIIKSGIEKLIRELELKGEL